ncbi:glycosyltransferase [Blastococcus sp. CT_GayMR16]|nr:glycosyltransferase [Blastococcus sp. CT_GayMR16]
MKPGPPTSVDHAASARTSCAGRRDLLLVTGDPTNNQMGRTQAVYRVAQAAGYAVTLVTASSAPGIWEPVRGADVDSALQRVTVGQLRERLAGRLHAVIALKPRWDSLGSVLRAFGPVRTPLLVDIDDPDLDVLRQSVFGRPSMLNLPRFAVRAARYGILARAVRGLPVLTSNPVLQRRHGGTLLPHARPDRGPGRPHMSRAPTIAFVGTPKAHKGIHLLRRATAELAVSGYRLVITADAPQDGSAAPWETWTGEVTEEQAYHLLSESDIVALPSLDEGWGRGQLPMKLIDGMLAGRAVVVSSLEPLTWALGDAGQAVPAGSLESLVCALRLYGDPAIRTAHGHAARTRALDRFTPTALVPSLTAAVSAARADVTQRRLG